MENSVIINTKYNENIIEITSKGTGIFEDHFDKMLREIIDLKRKSIRKALIDLGWAPPEENAKE